MMHIVLTAFVSVGHLSAMREPETVLLKQLAIFLDNVPFPAEEQGQQDVQSGPGVVVQTGLVSVTFLCHSCIL